MSERDRGIFLIAVPVALQRLHSRCSAARFDYPDILRRPTAEVLAALPRRRRRPDAALVGVRADRPCSSPRRRAALARDRRRRRRPCSRSPTTVGVLATVVQFLGLIRWPFLVPSWPGRRRSRRRARRGARRSTSSSSPSTATSASRWASTSATCSPALDDARGRGDRRRRRPSPAGSASSESSIGALLLLCSLEFVGPLRATRLEARRAADAAGLRRLVALARRAGIALLV